MDIESVYRALNAGTTATRSLLIEARKAEPAARERLIADLERRQAAIKCEAQITRQSAGQLAAHRERTSRNPVTLKWEQERQDAITQASLDTMQSELEAVAGLTRKLKALDVDTETVNDLTREGVIPRNEEATTE